MAGCKQCMLYIESYSNLQAEWQDALPIGEKPKEHFCLMYQEGIPDGIWDGRKTCAHKVKVNDKE